MYSHPRKPMAGFWRRQFQLPAPRSQRWFDLCFGIAVPILCLYLDPVVFRSFGTGQAPLLSHLRLFSHAEITLGIAALAYYLIMQRASLLLTGVLLGSSLFSIALGIAILPLTLVGLLIVLGALGLTPFVTSFVFLRNAVRSWRQSSTTTPRIPALLHTGLGLLLILGIPAAFHASVSNLTHRALVVLQSGSEQDFTDSVHTLKWLHYDTDDLAVAYQKNTDTAKRERLSRAFTDLTGGSIQDRLAQLSD
jgi:hypothetical protein